MEITKLQSRYYTVKQIQQNENCGRDMAYNIAKKLPHEKRGKRIYVFAEDYDNYYNRKREKAINGSNGARQNIYQLGNFK